MASKLTEFKNAVIARNVVARVLEATEFDSPEALKKYLHDHPGADKSNHSVKKEEKGEGGKEDKPLSQAEKSRMTRKPWLYKPEVIKKHFPETTDKQMEMMEKMQKK